MIPPKIKIYTPIGLDWKDGDDGSASISYSTNYGAVYRIFYDSDDDTYLTFEGDEMIASNQPSLEAAKKIGYDDHNRFLRMVLKDITDEFFDEILDTIEEVCAAHSFKSLGDPTEEIDALRDHLIKEISKLRDEDE